MTDRQLMKAQFTLKKNYPEKHNWLFANKKKVKSVKKTKRTKKIAKSTHAILIVHSFSSMPCQLESHITDVLSLRFLDFKSIYFGILPNEKKNPQKNEKKK